MAINNKRICIYVRKEHLTKIDEYKYKCGEKKFSENVCQLILKNINNQV